MAKQARKGLHKGKLPRTQAITPAGIRPSKRKASADTAPPVKGVKLADIARSIGKTEKSARQKMRKYTREKKLEGIPLTIPGKRWTFHPEHVESIKGWLQMDRRKNGLGQDETSGRVRARGNAGKDQDDRVRREPAVVSVSRPEVHRKRTLKGGRRKASGESAPRDGASVGKSTPPAAVVKDEKLTAQSLIVMAAIMGVSNLGQDYLVRGKRRTFLPDDAKRLATKGVSLSGAVLAIAGGIIESDEQHEMFLEEAKGWVQTLSRLTTNKIKETWSDYAEYVDAVMKRDTGE